jgi:hypothetical protein
MIGFAQKWVIGSSYLRIYELRKRKSPSITGAETLAVMVAGSAMSREHYNQLLKKLLDELGVIILDGMQCTECLPSPVGKDSEKA